MEGTASAIKDVTQNMKDFGTTAAEETGYMIDSSVKEITRLGVE